MFFIYVKCGMKIRTFWNDEDRIFDGHFIALDSRVSEIFEVFQPVMTEVICLECFTFKRR